MEKAAAAALDAGVTFITIFVFFVVGINISIFLGP